MSANLKGTNLQVSLENVCKLLLIIAIGSLITRGHEQKKIKLGSSDRFSVLRTLGAKC